MPHHALADLCHWMQVPCPAGLQIAGVSVDSRLVQRDDLFFALPGAKTDGLAFLTEAIVKGACAAVVGNRDVQVPENFPLIVVDNPLSALQSAARGVIQQLTASTVAVTGSLGKTTVKEFMAVLLKKRFRLFASPLNQNSQIGFPLAVLNNVEGNEELLILEMGMSFPGEISRLIEIAPPDIALITTTALVHACNFEDLEEIGRAKAEIFLHPQTKLGILDYQIVNFEQLVRMGLCRKISFALDYPLANYSLHVESRILTCREEGIKVEIPHLSLPGRHSLHNVLAASVTARQLGMEWDEIVERFPGLVLPERRLQAIEKRGVTFINDAYNAAEASLKAALSCLPAPKAQGRRIAVIGGVVELGKFSEPCHKAVGEFALDKVDEMLCLGSACLPIVDVWKAAQRPVEYFLDRAVLSKRLQEIMRPGDVVLLKGSRTHELWKILDDIEP